MAQPVTITLCALFLAWLAYLALGWMIDRRVQKAMKGYIVTGSITPRNKLGQFTSRRAV